MKGIYLDQKWVYSTLIVESSWIKKQSRKLRVITAIDRAFIRQSNANFSILLYMICISEQQQKNKLVSPATTTRNGTKTESRKKTESFFA